VTADPSDRETTKTTESEATTREKKATDDSGEAREGEPIDRSRDGRTARRSSPATLVAASFD